MNNKKTFHEVSEIWCDAKRPIVKHSTLCAYQLTLQTHLLPRFGAAEIHIEQNDIRLKGSHKKFDTGRLGSDFHLLHIRLQ